MRASPSQMRCRAASMRRAAPDRSSAATTSSCPGPQRPFSHTSRTGNRRSTARQPARVVGVRMRDRHHVEPRGAAVPEKGRHHALAHVEARAAARPAVHEEPGSLRHLDEDRVALADVEEGDAQAAVARARARARSTAATAPATRQQAAGAARPPPVHADGRARRRRPRRPWPPAGRRNVDQRVGYRPPPATPQPEQHHQRPGETEREGAGELADHGGGEPEEPGGGRRAASGTTTRFAARPISESWLKCAAMTGSDGGLRARAHRDGGGRPRRAAEPRERALPRRPRGTRCRPWPRRRAGSPGPRDRPAARARSASAARRQRVRELGLALEQHPAEQESPMMVARSTEACAPTTRAKPTSAGRRDPAVSAARDADHAERREDRGRDQRHVEARHGQHVIDAGAPEGVVHLARERRRARRGAGRRGARPSPRAARADPLHRPALHPRRPGRGSAVSGRTRSARPLPTSATPSRRSWAG